MITLVSTLNSERVTSFLDRLHARHPASVLSCAKGDSTDEFKNAGRQGRVVIVSVYLPPSKMLFRSDLETLLVLEDAVILFSDFNSKNAN
ncbi:hypothetical protein EVAR_7199_1 [Eumeta japonica]|uniref:Uncharacterized protein n=1 Tax=Eumeta variegata TaxID=151549 RepID=A0A4C1T4T6_EUMVA|nr:hypothetical protein EVAR_7199_1 [Eumeta japonica]